MAKSPEHCHYIPHSGRACCYHCGDWYQVTPASLTMVCAILKQYAKEHRRCKKTQRGEDLLAANVAAFDALPDDKKNVLGRLTMPAPKNMGEKIAQHIYMEEMAKEIAEKLPELEIKRD